MDRTPVPPANITSDPGQDVATPQSQPEDVPVDRLWQQAKTLLARAVKAEPSKLENAIGRALGGYVRASGGGGSISVTRKASGIISGIAGALSSISTSGSEDTFKELGLSHLVDAPPEVALAAIGDALLPSGATLEESSIRTAVLEAFRFLIQDLTETDTEFNLESLTGEHVRDLVLNAVSLSIYYRWLGLLGKRIEQYSISDSDAVQFENAAKQFIRNSLSLELSEHKALKVDWRGKQGQQIINRIFAQARSMLEGLE